MSYPARSWAKYLDPAELIEFTRFYAHEVASGKYPFVAYDACERWHQRIYRDPRVDIWLISWLPEQGTQLHDHGGSAGAFSVLTGRLTESVIVGKQIRDEPREAGASVGFGPRYVHDVRNVDLTPAVSVHAYSPPLTSMTYYDLDAGELIGLETVATDDPEPAARETHLRAS